MHFEDAGIEMVAELPVDIFLRQAQHLTAIADITLPGQEQRSTYVFFPSRHVAEINHGIARGGMEWDGMLTCGCGEVSAGLLSYLEHRCGRSSDARVSLCDTWHGCTDRPDTCRQGQDGARV